MDSYTLHPFLVGFLLELTDILHCTMPLGSLPGSEYITGQGGHMWVHSDIVVVEDNRPQDHSPISLSDKLGKGKNKPAATS